MNFRAPILFLAMTLAGSLSLKATQCSPTPRQALVAAYTRLDHALGPGGSPADLLVVLKDLLAPGTLREEVLRNTERNIKAGGDHDLKRMIAHSIKIQNLTVTENKAVALVEERAHVVRTDSEGLYGARGRNHHLSGSILYRDTWIKTQKGWKIATTGVIQENVMVDGKPVRPRAPATSQASSQNRRPLHP